MKKYKVVLKETLFDTFIVEANDEEEAKQRALDADDSFINAEEISDRWAECSGEATDKDEGHLYCLKYDDVK